jgi:hypothetical protein
MSLAVRLLVIDYAFIHSSGKKRQQNFPPRSVFFWVLMVSWRVTGNIVIRRSLCPVRVLLSSIMVQEAAKGSCSRICARMGLNLRSSPCNQQRKFYSRSHAVVVRVFDESGALIETHESDGVFREP